MSLLARCLLLHLKKKLRNDNKPFGSLSFATIEKENKNMMISQGGLPSSTTPKKKNKHDDELGKLAIICTVPIYKLNKMKTQHTQEIPTNITGVVLFGQEPVQMLYTSLPLSSLPLHLLGGGDIPTYKKV
jgi:hypothetical protein